MSQNERRQNSFQTGFLLIVAGPAWFGRTDRLFMSTSARSTMITVRVHIVIGPAVQDVPVPSWLAGRHGTVTSILGLWLVTAPKMMCALVCLWSCCTEKSAIVVSGIDGSKGVFHQFLVLCKDAAFCCYHAYVISISGWSLGGLQLIPRDPKDNGVATMLDDRTFCFVIQHGRHTVVLFFFLSPGIGCKPPIQWYFSAVYEYGGKEDLSECYWNSKGKMGGNYAFFRDN